MLLGGMVLLSGYNSTHVLGGNDPSKYLSCWTCCWHTQSQENSGIAFSGRCFSFLLRNGNYLKSRSKRRSSGGNVTHSTPWLLSCLPKGIWEVIVTCFWGCSTLLHNQPGWRGHLLPLCFVVPGSFWEAQLRGQQFPCWKVTCKWLSAAAAGPIFF